MIFKGTYSLPKDKNKPKVIGVGMAICIDAPKSIKITSGEGVKEVAIKQHKAMTTGISFKFFDNDKGLIELSENAIITDI